jgi:bla regulator protein BlaR1
VRLGARGPTAWTKGGLPDLSPASMASAGAASSLQQLKRRLEMLQHHSQDHPSRPAPVRRLGFCLLALLGAAALLPLRIVAAAPSQAADRPSPAIAAARAGVSAPASAAPTVSSAKLAGPVVAPAQLAGPMVEGGQGSATIAPAVAGDDDPPAESVDTMDSMTVPEPPAVPPPPLSPPPPPAPPAPAAPPAPPAPPAHYSASHLHMHSSGRMHDEVYVLLRGKGEIMVSGTPDDVDRARELQRKAGDGDILWTRRNGREYLIRDAATLQAVRDLFRPQEELGDQQGKLGDQQGQLGDKQGEIGDRQGELGDRQGELGDEQARLASEEATLAAEESSGDGRASEARERRRGELREARRKLSREMRALGEQQRELGEKQRELGKQQSELGRRQSILGREQERAAREAEAKLHALLDQAIAGGTAKEVK